MALVVKDRVRETSVTQGTGTFTLDGAVTGYQSFSAIGNGNTTYYTIYLQASNEWEVGIGTYTASGTTLSRDTILASSNGGAVVNFSAGTKDVFVTYPAGRSVYYDTATNVTVNQLSATTVDATNLEVTNIKAKDGTAALSIADSTGAVTVATAFTANGGAVFNENGADVDFRVEGDTDANLIFADASTDRVGIGTNSPVYKLTTNVTGGSATALFKTDQSTADIYLQASGTSQTYSVGIGASGNGMRFLSGAASNMLLDSSGNLGLGVTPSAWASWYRSLDMFGGGTFASSDAAFLSVFGHNVYYNGSNNIYKFNGGASQYIQGSGQHLWYNAPSGTANTTTITNGVSYTIITSGNQTDFGAANNNVGTSFTANASGTLSSGTVSQNISFNQAMTLDASGNLLVGATGGTPGRFGVSGVGGSSSPDVVIDSNGSYGELQSYNNKPLYINRQGNNVIINATSGNLGIGVTPSANAGQRGLFVSGFDGGYSAVSIGASQSGYGCVGYNIGFTNVQGTFKALATDAMSWIRFQAGSFQFFQQAAATAGTNYTGTQAMTLDASGNLLVGTTSASWNTSGRGLIEANGSSSFLYGGKVNDTQIGYFAGIASAIELAAVANVPIVFLTNNTERARITSVGGFETRPAATGHAVFNEDGVDADFRVESDAQSHMFFVDAGNNTVGVALSTPLDALDVNGRISTRNGFIANSAGSNQSGSAAFIRSLNGYSSASTPDYTWWYNDAAGFFHPASDVIGIATNGLERVRIANTGVVVNEDGYDCDFRVESDTDTHCLFVDASTNRVGIGTATPGAKLEVQAASPSIYLTATTTTGTTIGDKNNRLVLLSDSVTANNGGEIVFAATDTNVDRWAAISGAIQNNGVDGCTGDILFATKGTTTATTLTERARITSGGIFEMGGDNGLTSALKLSVTGATGEGAFLFKNDAGANQWTGWIWNTATSGDNLFVNFLTEGGSGTGRGSITYNRGGGVVAYNTTSDYRAKDLFGPVQNSGQVIDALKVYTGKMKGATIERPMLVAHEAQEHVPYAVTGEKDAVNEDGTPKYQQMDVSSLVPLLLAEIQSLRARVAQLEGK